MAAVIVPDDGGDSCSGCRLWQIGALFTYSPLLAMVMKMNDKILSNNHHIQLISLAVMALVIVWRRYKMFMPLKLNIKTEYTKQEAKGGRLDKIKQIDGWG